MFFGCFCMHCSVSRSCSAWHTPCYCTRTNRGDWFVFKNWELGHFSLLYSVVFVVLVFYLCYFRALFLSFSILEHPPITYSYNTHFSQSTPRESSNVRAKDRKRKKIFLFSRTSSKRHRRVDSSSIQKCWFTLMTLQKIFCIQYVSINS